MALWHLHETCLHVIASVLAHVGKLDNNRPAGTAKNVESQRHVCHVWMSFLS